MAPLQPSATMNQSIPIGPMGGDTAEIDIDVEQNPGWGLANNIDVLTCKAEWNYYRCIKIHEFIYLPEAVVFIT